MASTSDSFVLWSATYRILQIPSTVTRAQAADFLSTCGGLQGHGPLGPASNIRVHSLASRVGQSQSTKAATVTFVRLPPLLLDMKSQWSLLFTNQGIHGTITIDAAFSGLPILNDVQPDEHNVE
jgi:hypothetical protein